MNGKHSIFESGGCAFDPRRGRLGFFMKHSTPEEKLIHLLLERLERISADSYWAHQASGVRGALLRELGSENIRVNSEPKLKQLIEMGFNILEDAIHEKAGIKGTMRMAQHEIG